MSLKKSPTLTANYVLSQVSESQIFNAYFGECELGKRYPSFFRKDENPSTGFYISEAGKIIYNDLSTSEKLDCFAFVAKAFKLTYGRAVLKVACDFGIIECEGVVKFDRNKLKKSEIASEAIKKNTDITIQADYWEDEYIDYWKQYEISQQECENEGIYPVNKLIINEVTIPNFKNQLRFALTLEYKGKIYKKIYSPNAENKKFKWINNIPIYIPFGITSLPFKDERLFITKGQKDRIIFKKYFSDVLAVQNESPAALKEKTINYLKKKYKFIYINTDLDEAGLMCLEHFKQHGLIPLMLPEIVFKKHGVKDCSDFVKKFGLKRFENWLKYEKLI